MCACTEPVRTGIGAVCVEHGRPKWLINQTHVQKNVLIFLFYFWHPMLVRPAMKRLFCLKAKNGLGRFTPSAVRFSGSSLILSCLTVSFSCGIVYSLVKRTPESEKKKTYAYLIKRKIKKKMLLLIVRICTSLAWTEETTKINNIFMVCTGTKIKIFFMVILIPKLSLNFRKKLIGKGCPTTAAVLSCS